MNNEREEQGERHKRAMQALRKAERAAERAWPDIFFLAASVCLGAGAVELWSLALGASPKTAFWLGVAATVCTAGAFAALRLSQKENH